MSQTSSTPTQKVVTELKVSAHQMLLEPGLYCVFHAAGGPLPDATTGLPGVRVTRSPGTPPEALTISTFNPDGWLGLDGGAALVRATLPASQVLVTVYQTQNSTQEAPKLQVLRLGDVAARVAQPVAALPPATPAIAGPGQPQPAAKPEVAAHVQRRGDLLTRIGEWMGTRGSQNWIEGFAIAPQQLIEQADIEYQAVLGKGWLSPWADGGSYCGSRGMALPILGLRVRLKGEAAERYRVQVTASFTDGSAAGPVDGSETAEAPSLAPLEAFLVEILPIEGALEAGSSGAVPGEPAGEAARGRPRGFPKPADKPTVKPARPVARLLPTAKTGVKGRR